MPENLAGGGPTGPPARLQDTTPVTPPQGSVPGLLTDLPYVKVTAYGMYPRLPQHSGPAWHAAPPPGHHDTRLSIYKNRKHRNHGGSTVPPPHHVPPVPPGPGINPHKDRHGNIIYW